MIAYLDLHSGAVTAIATVALMVLTGVYVYLTWRLVLGMYKAREPFVAIDFEFPDHMLRFVVSNSGQTAARNIRFRIVKDLPWLSIFGKHGVAAIPVISNGISNLSPGKSLKFHAGVLHSIPKKETILSIEVTFENEFGNTFSRKEVIDFTQFDEVLFESFDRADKGVESAIESLTRLLDSKLSKDGFKMLSMKECPVCAESIPIKARKCSRCGEMIENKKVVD